MRDRADAIRFAGHVRELVARLERELQQPELDRGAVADLARSVLRASDVLRRATVRLLEERRP